MALASDIKWNTGHHRCMVQVGTYSLSFSVSGPDRKPNEPLVLVLPGLGCSSLEWAAVNRALSSFTRVLLYDRPGYGNSEISPETSSVSTAHNAATELNFALELASIEPPFIIVCHSWAGIVARELLELRKDDNDIIGMVFVDANQEKSATAPNWHAPEIRAVAKDLSYVDVVGLNRDHKLTTDEWNAVLDEEESEKHRVAEAAEMAGLPLSYETLRVKRQFERNPPVLGDYPVAVLTGNTVKDFEKLYKAGVAAGNGSKAERKVFEKLIAEWPSRDKNMQEEILKLSTKGRSRWTKNSGHNIHLTEPELIIEDVKWVLENLPE